MYGKIFSSIFDSSLAADGGWLPTYIFMSMITIADKNGIVDIAPKALFRRLGFRDYDNKITYEEFQTALEYLSNEDPDSQSRAENGRRIIPVSQIDEIEGNRGWLIVNYEVYRQKASRTEQQGSSTERVRRFRERQKNNDLKNGNGHVTACNVMERYGNGHTDTDTDNGNVPDGTLPTTGVSNETPSVDSPEKPTRSPPCPYVKIMEAFNAAAHQSWITADIDTLAKSEKANIRARWSWVLKRPIKDEEGKRTRTRYAEAPEKAIEWFRRFFQYAATCEQLTRENDIGWSMDLAWLMREKNFLATVRGTKQGRVKS